MSRRRVVPGAVASLLLAFQPAHPAAAETAAPEQIAASSPRATPFGRTFIAPEGFR